ncbi:MAG: AMP-binding protein [Chloroflexi bacterium]|nr:AMP-binding protein [Chloroflexota bacterium]
MTLISSLARHAETIPDQLFTRIVKKSVVEKTRTFAEAYSWALQWAALFSHWNIRHGSTVLIALPNCDAFAGAYFGALMAGAIPAPVAPIRKLEPHDPYIQTIVERIKFINAKAIVVPIEQSEIVTWDEFKNVVVLTEQQAEASIGVGVAHSSLDDLGLIQFTSGTSGKPKAVMLTQRALIAQLEMLKHSLALYDRFKDWGVSWLPLFHDMGLIGFLLTPMYTGGSVTLLPTEEFIFRPSAWLKAITEYKATITGAPPSAYALCAKRIKDAEVAQYDLSSIRVALVGAEAVTRESLDLFTKKFSAAGFRATAFMPTYGLAENCLAVTMPPLDHEPQFDQIDFRKMADGIAEDSREGETRFFANVGRALPDTEVTIVDPRGCRLPERRIGEIVIKSPCVMKGYYNDLRNTEYALRDDSLFTGDLGYLVNDDLHLTGRLKEVIIVGGRNYYPDDVEQLVNAVDGIRAERVVAIGVEDIENATEKLIVLAETDKTESSERDALRMTIRQTLIDAGYPVGDVVLLKPKSIHSTLTGKPQRLECKQRYTHGEFTG